MGTLAFVGEGGTASFQPSRLLIHKQLILMDSWVCGLVGMEDLLELLARKGLHPEDTVIHAFPLAEDGEAYWLLAESKTGKVVLAWP